MVAESNRMKEWLSITNYRLVGKFLQVQFQYKNNEAIFSTDIISVDWFYNTWESEIYLQKKLVAPIFLFEPYVSPGISVNDPIVFILLQPKFILN